MKIRPKNTILFAQTGVKFSQNNLRGANWRQQVFNNYRQHLLDQLAKYGEARDYGDWLNEMQSRHANIYNLAGGEKGNWENVAYKNDLVGQYQQDYRGGLGNDGQYKRFGTTQINPDDKYDFNQTGIRPNQTSRYIIQNPPSRTSGDYYRDGYDYKPDNYYSAITDDRRILGRANDWDENSQEYKDFIKELNSRGWTMELDNSDSYYKLKRIGNPDPSQTTSDPKQKQGTVNPYHNDGKYGFDWDKVSEGFKKYFPDALALGRLAGNLATNERMYDAKLKAISPALQQSYNTHRQVVGDEATKQAYYKQAVQGEQKAARPFTSDADRQVAYMNEAKRIGDELRAKGDLADNQEIRRTSDESNQHQWANTERRTRVANDNTIRLAQANEQRQNLIAEKYAANWSNLDNYLQGIERKVLSKQAEDKALNDQIFALNEKLRMSNDPELLRARSKLMDALKNHDYDRYDPEVREAKKEYDEIFTKLSIESYRRKQNQNFSIFAKEGTKITKKTNSDKYLYKTTKDVVEHFRKMVKMTDDSTHKSKTKPVKLNSHPNGSRRTRRMQSGGVAPFVIYRPTVLGGETSVQQSTSSSTSKSDNNVEKETLDVIKSLFANTDGLPIDVEVVSQSINRLLTGTQMLNEKLDYDDLASLYLGWMSKITNLKYSKARHDDAVKLATQNDALGEFAVTDRGTYIAQDKNGNIKEVSLNEIKNNKLNPLTNQDLINLRGYSKNMALGAGDEYMGIVANGVGMSKIAKDIKLLLPTIGTDELVKEGYTHHQAGQIVKGLELLKDAPEGDYSYKISSKDQQRQISSALTYVMGMLPRKYKSVLQINAFAQGTTVEELLKPLIGTGNHSESLTFNSITKGSSKSSDGSSKSSKELELDAASALISGKGYKSEINLNPGSSYSVTVQGRFSQFQKHNQENMGAGTTMQEATESTVNGTLDWNNATIGGSRIIPTGYNQIILNNGQIASMDLPVDPSNPDIPNFEMLKQLENLDKQLKLNNIEDNEQNWQKVNDLCDKLNIPRKYDSSGKLNNITWKRFAAFQVTAPDTVLVDKNVILDMVGIANEQERELYSKFIQQKTNNKKFELSDSLFGIGHKDELYKGTVFVPIMESYVAAAISSGQNISMSQAKDLELREQGYDPDKVKSYKKPEHRL